MRLDAKALGHGLTRNFFFSSSKCSVDARICFTISFILSSPELISAALSTDPNRKAAESGRADVADISEKQAFLDAAEATKAKYELTFPPSNQTLQGPRLV